MDVTAALIELKPGSGQRVADWAEYIRNHHGEALETLRAEGVSVESWFSLSIDGKDYLICYMRATSSEKAAAVARESASPVDKFHQAFKRETWACGTQATLLVDLIAQDR